MNRITSRLYKLANRQSTLNFDFGYSKFDENVISESEFLNSTEMKAFRKSLQLFPQYYKDGGESVMNGVDLINKKAKQLIQYLNDEVINRNEAFIHSWSMGNVKIDKNHNMRF